MTSQGGYMNKGQGMVPALKGETLINQGLHISLRMFF